MSGQNNGRLLRRLDSPRVVFSIVVLMFLVFLSPYVIKGWDVWINQFDNLDQISSVGIFDGQFRGQFWPGEDMPEYYLPGMEPIFRVSILSVQKLFWQFGFFPGYVINEMVYRILGFMGFYLLLRRLFMKDMPRMLPALLALAYVYLPFWPQGGLSIAGLPLLAWALLLIWNKDRPALGYAVVVLYTLYSGFFLTGVFVIMILALCAVWLAVKRKPFWRLVFPMLLMLVIYLAVYYSYFIIAFVQQIPTNRSEIQLASRNLGVVLRGSFLGFFTRSHVHAHSFQAYILLPVSILGLWAMLRNRAYTWRRLALGLGGFLVFCAALVALYNYKPFNDIYNSMRFGFDYSRFYFLTPPVWYMLASISLAYYVHKARWKRLATYICLVVLLAQLGLNFTKSSWKTWTLKPTLREVMSVEQFARIDGYLRQHEPGYSQQSVRIGCIGFSPSVANFNGFRTLGAYRPSYPLHLKDDFIEILAGEMDRNERLKQYMEKWGSQLYLFDDRIFIHILDQRELQRKVRSTTCEMNLDKLREMGVSMLFSAVPIANATEVGLVPVVRDTAGYYRLYVYRL